MCCSPDFAPDQACCLPRAAPALGLQLLWFGRRRMKKGHITDARIIGPILRVSPYPSLGGGQPQTQGLLGGIINSIGNTPGAIGNLIEGIGIAAALTLVRQIKPRLCLLSRKFSVSP